MTTLGSAGCLIKFKSDVPVCLKHFISMIKISLATLSSSLDQIMELNSLIKHVGVYFRRMVSCIKVLA